MSERFAVESVEVGKRLDQFVHARMPEHSRAFLQKLIREGHVHVGGKVAKQNYKVRAGDSVSVEIPAPRPLDVAPEAIPLKILHEDRDLLVLDKSAGMVVHPAAGNQHGTLVSALLAHCGSTLSGIGGVMRPGIVHRLDKDTTGVMVVAKTSQALRNLKQQFKQHKVEKRYQALVVGKLSVPLGQIEAPLLTRARAKGKVRVAAVASAKVAVTNYQVEEQLGEFTLLSLQPLTGRTHQIRVHLRAIGHPILGDPIYGSRRWNRWAKKRLGLERPFLHAHELSFRHPLTKEQVSFKAPLAKDLKVALAALP